MLDQSLLDKQYMLEFFVDILEKNANGSLSASQQRSSQPISSAPFPQLNAAVQTPTAQPSTFHELSTTRILLITTTQNMHHFLQSELLSRRLAYFCCKRISNMFHEFSHGLFEKACKQIAIQNEKTPTPPPPPTPATIINDRFTKTNYVLKKTVSLASVSSSSQSHSLRQNCL